jgi:uncharacterized protein YukE
MRGIINNRFYLGELPFGNGWIKGKHQPLIKEELFNAAQEARAHRHHVRRNSVVNKARTFSLSGLMQCHFCGSKVHIHQGHGGRPRVFCAGRSQGLECKCKCTFLDVYEAQIEWYLKSFIIPEDYQKKILEMHEKLQSAYNDTAKQQATLESRLERIKELYSWGHIARDKYLTEYEEIQKELKGLIPAEEKNKNLDKLAHFLSHVADAWEEADQEQRNKLANAIFEQIWIENDRVTEVKPRPEMTPFFQLSHECHSESIGCSGRSPSGSHLQYVV